MALQTSLMCVCESEQTLCISRPSTKTRGRTAGLNSQCVRASLCVLNCGLWFSFFTVGHHYHGNMVAKRSLKLFVSDYTPKDLLLCPVWYPIEVHL